MNAIGIVSSFGRCFICRIFHTINLKLSTKTPGHYLKNNGVQRGRHFSISTAATVNDTTPLHYKYP